MGSESTATVKIPSKTWWEMRRLKYNIIVGCIGILIILDLNLYIKKGASFDAVFFFTSIAVGIIYAILCNLTYTLLWMLDNLSFGNDLVDFHSPKRTLILYLFVFLSSMVPFGILHLVKDLL
ncbi:MAG TPA: hypothetical protein PKI86_07865 [Chitinophagales bacterium]|nr:hypothetical protein [Chitinophagales bacterium]